MPKGYFEKLFTDSKSAKALNDRVYLDFGSATPCTDKVFEKMRPYFTKHFGNASALHKEGRDANAAVEQARETIAHLLEVHSEEIIFTSGGTEGNNLAIKGAAGHLMDEGMALSQMHFITSHIEHPSVLAVFKSLEKKGARVTYLSPDRNGMFRAEQVEEALLPHTVLVSLAYVNSEIGTLNPVSQIGKRIEAWRKKHQSLYPYFHTDASQAPLYVRVAPHHLRADLMTLDAQKLYGPKGIGMLYRRQGVDIATQIEGGGQEGGLRSGTENTPLIVGLATALEFAITHRESRSEQVREMRDYFFNRLLSEIPHTVANGDRERRIANNVNVSIQGIDGAFFVVLLDEEGIAAGSQSACFGGDPGGSHVIYAISKDKERSESSLRFTLGTETTKSDIDRVMDAIKRRLP